MARGTLAVIEAPLLENLSLRSLTATANHSRERRDYPTVGKAESETAPGRLRPIDPGTVAACQNTSLACS